MILLTRKADFSSAHFYWNDAWSLRRKPARLRQMRQPQRPRPQLHPRSHRRRRDRPRHRLRRRPQAAQRHPRERSRQRLRPPPPQPRSPRVRHHHPHHRKHRHRHLAPPRRQDPQRDAPPRPRLRDARPLRRLLRRRRMSAAHTRTSRRRYHFSASHRLHADALTDAAKPRGLRQMQQPLRPRPQLHRQVTYSGPVDARHRHGHQPRRPRRLRPPHLLAASPSPISTPSLHFRISSPPPRISPSSYTGSSPRSPTPISKRIHVEETSNNSFDYSGAA